MRLNGRPLTRQDAVHAGVTQRFIGRPLVIAQHAIKFRAEALNRAPTLMIEEVSAKLDRDTLQLFKCMGQEHELALGI